MYYKCEDCGHIFEEGEQSHWTEPHGERLSGCPICNGAYEEVHYCSICGDLSCAMGEDVCEDCKNRLQKEFVNFWNSYTDEEQEFITENMGDWT